MKTLEQLHRTILLCRDYVADALSDEEICAEFQRSNVLCVSDQASLSTHSGQTALVTLVCLLSRMGMQVAVEVSDAALIRPQPPLLGESILDMLLASSDAVLTGATVRLGHDIVPDLVFVVGEASKKEVDAPCWFLNGTDWLGSIGMRSRHPWTTEWPIGAMVSAALGANEAFKFVLRRLPLRDHSDEVFFQATPKCSFDFGWVSVPEGQIDLGQVDLISAGAISQAALFTLLRVPGLRMHGRIFDDDSNAASNLNRNMLSLVSDIGMPKVETAALRCSPVILLQPIEKRFSGNTISEQLSDRVLVGVDDIPSRWEVQRRAPRWLGVSGTSHFSISSSSHGGGQPCCGCLHPLDDATGIAPIPTISFVSFWAGLAMAVRLMRDVLSVPYTAERQHLWVTPLRMDERHAAMWMAVAPCLECPVRCSASRALLAL